MTRLTNDMHHLAVPLPITAAGRQAAEAFARAQPNPAKAEAVRLNTLAVWVTHQYFQMMDIPTDLHGSDSWNPLMQLTANVADLRLPDLGQLECRPVRSGESVCSVPPEVWDLRIGYVVVAVAEDGQTAQLLGFSPAVQGETLLLASLQPPEMLLDHLYALRQSSMPEPEPASPNGLIVNLGRWLDGLFDVGWQTVDSLLAPGVSPAFSFRHGMEDTVPSATAEDPAAKVRRAKLIDLAIQLGLQQVVLLVDLQGEEAGSRQVGLQVHPAGSSPYLPPGLDLLVLEADGTPFMQAQSRQADDFIQLQFSGQPGEPFRVLLRLEDAEYGENFLI